MKKIACLLLCLGSQPLHAVSHDFFTGYYFTAGIGAVNARFDVNHTFESGVEILGFGPFASRITSLILNEPINTNLSANSIGAQLGIGYSYEFTNHLVLGASINAGYANAKTGSLPGFDINATNNFTFDNRYHAQLSNDFSVLAKLGYVIGGDTQFYALVGPRWGNFQTTARSVFGADTQGFLYEFLNGEDSEYGYELGFTAGVGVQHAVTDFVRLGLEYAFTTYGNIDSPSFSDSLNFDDIIVGFIQDESKISVNTNTLMVTLGYQW